jgi:hypothetical protein
MEVFWSYIALIRALFKAGALCYNCVPPFDLTQITNFADDNFVVLWNKILSNLNANLEKTGTGCILQIISNCRQNTFDIPNPSKYKIGNNIMANKLPCISQKIQIDFFNPKFPTFKYKIWKKTCEWWAYFHIKFFKFYSVFLLLLYFANLIATYVKGIVTNKLFSNIKKIKSFQKNNTK